MHGESPIAIPFEQYQLADAYAPIADQAKCTTKELGYRTKKLAAIDGDESTLSKQDMEQAELILVEGQ
jgi:hypothetical protein